ncbi:hypothetical protein SFC65_19730 [Priestia filamentosa]|uniref:hypothetical protein n=1 Tax=Priestia filamentosa TaxID=1402861 RepID=UPI0039820CA6
MEKMKFEMKRVNTIEELVELATGNPFAPTVGLIEESGNLAFAIKFTEGDYGLYSGHSVVVSKHKEHIRHEHSEGGDTFVVYELKDDRLEVISVSTNRVHEEYNSASATRYIIHNTDEGPEVWVINLGKAEALIMSMKIKEPRVKDFDVVSYTLDQEEIDDEGEQVGEIILKDTETGELHNNAIWFDEEGNHYFCWETGELDKYDNEVFDDYLLSDCTDYCNPNDI